MLGPREMIGLRTVRLASLTPRVNAQSCPSFEAKRADLDPLVSLFALFVDLGGCAYVPDAVSNSSADPAKYDLYDCKQLEAERKSLVTKTAELEGLIA